MNSSSSWLDEASQLPIAFAQVREDALLDLEVLERSGGEARIILVASGGCTAAALAASPLSTHLHLVDPNPAQLALARLKLRLMQTTDLPPRLAVLGHEPMEPEHRRRCLHAELAALDLPEDILGPPEFIARVGPDHAGRYERLFAELRAALSEQASDLACLLELNDSEEQARRVGPLTDLGRALDDAFDRIMALPNLVRLFGEGATRNRVEPFARHFARRIRHALATLPAATNPYLWQLLRGRFPPSTVYPWLTMRATARLPRVTWSAKPMADVLAAEVDAFTIVHLSNILDWLSIEEAQHTLELAWQALRPGGFVLIRQLNSTLDIPVLGRQFQWQPEAKTMHARDRSFFYRSLHLGRRL